MTAWIASLALPADTPPAGREAAYAAALRSFGRGQVDAWLEEPLSFERGLELREGIEPDDTPGLLRLWPIGRLFNEAADLRWERAPDGSEHLVLISDEGPDAPFDRYPHGLSPVDPSGSEERLLLWGERRDGRWHEGRIPQIGRCYPKTWVGPRAALRVRTYEAAWPEVDSARVIVRYLGYNGAYDPGETKEVTI